jgi:hypothetical protein
VLEVELGTGKLVEDRFLDDGGVRKIVAFADDCHDCTVVKQFLAAGTFLQGEEEKGFIRSSKQIKSTTTRRTDHESHT